PGSPADSRRQAQEINQQKDGIASDLSSLTKQLEALSNSQENRDAASKARTAANTIKGQQLQDRVEAGRKFLENGTPQNGYYNYPAQNERAIEKGLDDVQKQIGQAASAASNNAEDKKLQNALNQTSDTIQRLQSMLQRQQALQNGQSQQNPQNRGQQPGQQQGQQPGQQQGQQQGQGQQPGQQQGQQQGQGQQPGQQQGQQQGQGQQPGQGQQQGGGQQGGGNQQADGRNPGNRTGGNPNGGQYQNSDPFNGGSYDPR